eukprot:TRINITY_DN1125_c0_g1_i2.p1 TRINITY_DN1125_c0_g1~~TRINITY_DN1125_c0_g1_i2.p1  ORF type:complete len:225 (-),score=10.55 TRINITY_DN1125_c0_g1_i2:604-1278(-)
MCIFSIILDHHSEFDFILCFSRDMDPTRQTTQGYTDEDGIWAGRDVKRGGTWLGFNTVNGTLTFLTNVDPLSDEVKGNDYLSRGKLVIDCLKSGKIPLISDGSKYTGFNMFSANLYAPSITVYATSNRPNESPCRVMEFQKGVTTVSNSWLPFKDRPMPEWPKVDFMRSRIESLFQSNPSQTIDELVNNLGDILYDKTNFKEHPNYPSVEFFHPSEYPGGPEVS